MLIKKQNPDRRIQIKIAARQENYYFWIIYYRLTRYEISLHFSFSSGFPVRLEIYLVGMIWDQILNWTHNKKKQIYVNFYLEAVLMFSWWFVIAENFDRSIIDDVLLIVRYVSVIILKKNDENFLWSHIIVLW